MGSVVSTPERRIFLIACSTAILIVNGLWILFRKKPMITPSDKHAVFITGCDSGLGYSLALYGYKLGLTVIAGCLRSDSYGAKELQEKCPERLHVIELDITNTQSVIRSVQRIHDLIKKYNFGK